MDTFGNCLKPLLLKYAIFGDTLIISNICIPARVSLVLLIFSQ